MVFDLSTLTPEQRAITERAIAVCDFDWNLLRPELASEVGRNAIPVEWADLSRWNQQAEASHGHAHIEEDGDHAGLIAGEFQGRRAALGLAWYSGKISIEASLVSNPDLAIEVFLAEGAHMVDFFYMTTEQKRSIFEAYHPGMTPAEVSSHGHDWFDDVDEVGDPNVKNPDYWSWVGESFMSGFMMAYAPNAPKPLEARQPWVHRTTPEIAARIREILTPTPVVPDPPLETPPQVYVTSKYGTLYHRPDCGRAARIKHRIELPTVPDKRRPCATCSP